VQFLGLTTASNQMEEGADEVGLRINEEKPKYMINTRNKVRFSNEKHPQIYIYVTMNFKEWESSST